MKNTQKNELQTTDTAVAVKSPLRRPLIVLLAVFVALCLLTSALAVFTFVDFSKKNTGGGTQDSGFDYYAALLSDYVEGLKESMITGLTIPGFESRVDEITDENVKKYINNILLSNVALKDDQISEKNYFFAAKRTQAIDYADDVFFYILDVTTEDGAPIGVDFFENAYMEAGRVQIGMEYFGKDFDDKLIGMVPSNTWTETRTYGTVAPDDVIIFSYTATETVKATEEGKGDTVKNHKNYTALRLDLAEVEDTAWRDQLLASYGAVGQYFFFEYEEDIDEDGEKEKVKYEGMIDAVVTEEKTDVLTATLPEKFFGANPTDEKYAALNGATLKFHIVIDHTVPHEANTFETMTKADIETVNTFLSENGFSTFTASNDKSTVVNSKEQKGELTTLTTDVSTLKSEIKKLKGEIETLKGQIADFEASSEDKTADIEKNNASLAEKEPALAEKESKLKEKETALDAALAVARGECFDFLKKELGGAYDETVKMTAEQLVYNYLLENLVFTNLPADEVAAMEEYAKQSVEADYAAMDAASKRNYRDIEQFAASYFGYDEKEYEGYEHYIETYLAPYEIKASLLLPAIYNTFINDVTKLDAAIEEYLAEEIALAAAAGQPVTRQEILDGFKENYGDDYWTLLRQDMINTVVCDYLVENNTIDWEMRSPEKN
ncbi:MAG: hypothetical protein E7609_02675 [Ruminococcaceae bacterium]|nr:hypothetical protein [Oscillospiraceae bacterium]